MSPASVQNAARHEDRSKVLMAQEEDLPRLTLVVPDQVMKPKPNMTNKPRLWPRLVSAYLGIAGSASIARMGLELSLSDSDTSRWILTVFERFDRGLPFASAGPREILNEVVARVAALWNLVLPFALVGLAWHMWRHPENARRGMLWAAYGLVLPVLLGAAAFALYGAPMATAPVQYVHVAITLCSAGVLPATVFLMVHSLASTPTPVRRMVCMMLVAAAAARGLFVFRQIMESAAAGEPGRFLANTGRTVYSILRLLSAPLALLVWRSAMIRRRLWLVFGLVSVVWVTWKLLGVVVPSQWTSQWRWLCAVGMDLCEPIRLGALGIIAWLFMAREDAQDTLLKTCHSCAYNLTGNVSGVCPECGERVRIECAVGAGGAGR